MSTIDDADARLDEFLSQLDKVRPVTRRLIESLMLDAWPNHTAIVDFGIDSQAHYEALYYPIREGTIMPLALDDALGHGEKLTRMTREADSNPHKDIEFHTSWDVILGRDGSMTAEAPPRLPTPSEIIKDRKASKGAEPQPARDSGRGRDDGGDR
jgi:hypothetical protein